MERNPGSRLALYTIDYFALVLLWVRIFSCLPILGFDGTHSNHAKYRGVILIMLGRDSNEINITLVILVFIITT